jgi:peptidoglycan/xylan/chitin deacetylase (PgdA/CDA1 family)
MTTAAGLLATASCAAPLEEEEEAGHYQEDGLTGSYSDSSGSFQYVDTHDGYAHNGVVDKTNFLYFKRVSGKPAVGLTMDCAWVEPANAYEILDVLKQNDVKITFFISGPFIFKTPRRGVEGGLVTANLPVIKRMIEDGHEFGSHTQNHPHNNQSIDWTRENEELSRGWDSVLGALYPQGTTLPANAKLLPYWRAPYGEYDKRSLGLAAKAGFPYHFGWNVDVRDSSGIADCAVKPNATCLSPAKLTDYVLAFGEKNHWSLDGFVILSHLQNPYHWGSKPEGLQRLITTARAKGHVMARLSEMFADPSAER